MDAIETPRLRIELLDEEAMEQLLRNPPAWASGSFAWFLRFLRMRLDQLRRDPSFAPWAPRLIVLREDPGVVVGNAGFHGPPGLNARNDARAVEIGYSILDERRRRGYATEAVRALVEWALAHPDVDRVIASIAPTNEPSLALARRLGFVEVGRHWDEEDGDELEFELGRGRPT